MINANSLYNQIKVKMNKHCQYCGSTDFSSTGIVNANGIEVACDTCGTIRYINFIESNGYGDM